MGGSRQYSAMIGAQDTLSLWENFYIIVGSSAGALTGLQFVVMALVAESQARTSTREIDAFGTPTIVHFCAVLLVASILSAPWPKLWQAAAAVAICGTFGVGYTLIVIRRARRTTNYKPELEDWIWHAALPLIGYVILLVGGVALAVRHVPALFGIAVFALLLLFVGIHNAWDTVTYVAVGMHPAPEPSGKLPPPSDASR
jgi:hypothetical protein